MLNETVAAAKDGSADAYRQLLEAYGPRLYGYFFRATRRHHDAEDLLGEMALKLVRQLKSYDDRGRFEPWLFRIAANMVRDRIRRAKVRPKVISLSGDGEDRRLSDTLRADNLAVDSGVLAEEMSERLQRALEVLDPTTRQMVLQRYFGQLTFKELAEQFDCPLGTVLAKVHRGLKALRKAMNDDDAVE
ncbi:MAG: RNA polymerase sigma factor [Planctomycetota bacterium]